MLKRRLQRQNSDTWIPPPPARPRLAPAQSALLARFGLVGDAARNAPQLRAYASEPMGSDAYRASQLARALASGRFGTARRAPAIANARLVKGLGDKAAYNRALAAARARKNVAGAGALRTAWKARRTNQRRAAVAAAAAAAVQRRARQGGARAALRAQSPADRMRRIRASQASGPRSYAVLDGAVAKVHASSGGAKRAALKRVVGHVWDAVDSLVRLSDPPLTLELYLSRYLAEHGASIAAQTMAKKTKRMQQAALAGQHVAGAVTGWVARSACAMVGVQAPLLAFAVQGAAFVWGNKAYLAVEKNYVQWADGLARAASGMDATRVRHLAPLGVMAGHLVNVAGCLKAPIIGNLIREALNDFIRVQAGAELDYVLLTKVLMAHRGDLDRFLRGDPRARLRGLMVDAVDALPAAHVDAAADAVRAKLMSWASAPSIAMA